LVTFAAALDEFHPPSQALGWRDQEFVCMLDFRVVAPVTPNGTFSFFNVTLPEEDDDALDINCRPRPQYRLFGLLHHANPAIT